MPRFTQHPLTPLLLLAVTLTVGFFTFRDYGLSWDEPLFYDYADSIRLAYTPQAFAPTFDFYTVYGPSPEDHKFYGPAYLLLARPVQQAVMAVFGADRASAWHLVNFLTFQVGLIFFFFLLRRWLDPWPAAVSTAFFAFQPVFWGHAFINPKDMPFMVFFLAAVTLGFGMVDRFEVESRKLKVGWVIMAGFVLGCASAIRILGPLAGGLVFVYFLFRVPDLTGFWKPVRSGFPFFIVYGLVALLTMFAAWPYLWADPLNRFIEVLRHMSNNPTQLSVLFMGQIFPADALPRRYFPQMLALTFTEPTWILFFAGITLATRNKKRNGQTLALLAWFGMLFGYVVAVVPPMYDGFRHFLFILPPVFIFCGFALQWLWEKIHRSFWYIPVALLLLMPGLLRVARTHPYEYTAYNVFAGNVYREYETDYWLTCYKEAIEWTRTHGAQKTLYIQREFPIAAYYGAGLNLKSLGAESDPQPGDWLLFSTRANLDIKSVYRKLPVVQSFGRNGAEFCIIKEKD